MSKKNKFDLTHLVQSGYLKNGESLFFVSDKDQKTEIVKQPNGEYKLQFGEDVCTVHMVAQKLLGQEPPGHASRWLCTQTGKTLYELWQMDLEGEPLAA